MFRTPRVSGDSLHSLKRPLICMAVDIIASAGRYFRPYHISPSDASAQRLVQVGRCSNSIGVDRTQHYLA